MKKINKIIKNGRIHFIGIGGISMSGLARYCQNSGGIVSGSDTSKSDIVNELTELGIKVRIGHSAVSVIGAKTVVYTSAISMDNPELVKALKSGKNVLKRSELLGAIVEKYSNSIAVSGSHGKTTTTAMLTAVFSANGLNPTAFIGGEDVKFSNFVKGGEEYIITEACEYKRNFLDIKPKVAVVLNIDDDHLDSYGSIENEISCFNKFIENTVAIINSDDINSKNLYSESQISFGIDNPATITAKTIRKGKEGYSFTVYSHNKKLGRINLKVLGKHNVYNALATVAVCDYYKIDFSVIKFALENFTSVKRRNELIGKYNGVEVYADYAHHPKELKASINALSTEKDKTLIIFQPHTYSRTKNLMDEFVDALKDKGDIIIYKTYGARETFDECGSAYSLYLRIKEENSYKTVYSDNEEELRENMSKAVRNKDRILVLGAGDIYYKIQDIKNEKNLSKD